MPKKKQGPSFLVRATLLTRTGPICALCGSRLALGWVVAFGSSGHTHKAHQGCAWDTLQDAAQVLQDLHADQTEREPSDEERLPRCL